MATTRERTTKTSQRWLDSLILTTHTKRIDPSMPVNFDHAQHWLISGFVVATHLASRRECARGTRRRCFAREERRHGVIEEPQRSVNDSSGEGKLPPIFGSMFATRTVSSKRNGAPRCGWRIMSGRRRSLEKKQNKRKQPGRGPTHLREKHLRERTRARLDEGAKVRARFRLDDL